MSVSPRQVDSEEVQILNGEMSEDSDKVDQLFEGEKLCLEEEDKFVRKLHDPKLPSKEDVENIF